MNGCNSSLRFLRPYTCRDLPAARKYAYLRFFSSTRHLKSPTDSDTTHPVSSASLRARSRGTPIAAPSLGKSTVVEVDGNNDEASIRVRKLDKYNKLQWPRLQRDPKAISIAEFLKRYKSTAPGEKLDEFVTVYGRVRSKRMLGKKLAFVDIVQDGQLVQGLVNSSVLALHDGSVLKDFQHFAQCCRAGDVISLSGFPHKTKGSKGELSVYCELVPTILAPSLHTLPDGLTDVEALIRNRHVDLLVHDKAAHVVRVRSHIIQTMRNFLLDDDFLEMQTPVIADTAGGAIARSFKTTATEFPEKELALRIAPELWLKRLVIGGMPRVFEIGPVFRNEGLDGTHNAEFTTCEFYKSFAELEELMEMTEKMIAAIAQRVTDERSKKLNTLPQVSEGLVKTPYNRIQFIPAIEEAIGAKLPDLTSDNATERVMALFADNDLSIPAVPTLPRLLDKLGSIYIEPRCEEPTFITHHPACMAPLSKSFLDTKTNQIVSARAELFIQQREIANMYEEENSPFEQRAKFTQQSKYRDAENDAHVDQSYLGALEWGLPPTGGWGCGVDRLVMLFTGSTRITEVLPFGNLRNVVNLGTLAPRTSLVSKTKERELSKEKAFTLEKSKEWLGKNYGPKTMGPLS